MEEILQLGLEAFRIPFDYILTEEYFSVKEIYRYVPNLPLSDQGVANVKDFPTNIVENLSSWHGVDPQELSWRLVAKLDNGCFIFFKAWCDHKYFGSIGNMKLYSCKSLEALLEYALETEDRVLLGVRLEEHNEEQEKEGQAKEEEQKENPRCFSEDNIIYRWKQFKDHSDDDDDDDDEDSQRTLVNTREDSVEDRPLPLTENDIHLIRVSKILKDLYEQVLDRIDRGNQYFSDEKDFERVERKYANLEYEFEHLEESYYQLRLKYDPPLLIDQVETMPLIVEDYLIDTPLEAKPVVEDQTDDIMDQFLRFVRETTVVDPFAGPMVELQELTPRCSLDPILEVVEENLPTPVVVEAVRGETPEETLLPVEPESEPGFELVPDQLRDSTQETAPDPSEVPAEEIFESQPTVTPAPTGLWGLLSSLWN